MSEGNRRATIQQIDQLLHRRAQVLQNLINVFNLEMRTQTVRDLSTMRTTAKALVRERYDDPTVRLYDHVNKLHGAITGRAVENRSSVSNSELGPEDYFDEIQIKDFATAEAIVLLAFLRWLENQTDQPVVLTMGDDVYTAKGIEAFLSPPTSTAKHSSSSIPEVNRQTDLDAKDWGDLPREIVAKLSERMGTLKDGEYGVRVATVKNLLNSKTPESASVMMSTRYRDFPRFTLEDFIDNPWGEDVDGRTKFFRLSDAILIACDMKENHLLKAVLQEGSVLKRRRKSNRNNGASTVGEENTLPDWVQEIRHKDVWVQAMLRGESYKVASGIYIRLSYLADSIVGGEPRDTRSALKRKLHYAGSLGIEGLDSQEEVIRLDDAKEFISYAIISPNMGLRCWRLRS